MKRQNTKRLEQGPKYPDWNGLLPELQLVTAAITARVSENRVASELHPKVRNQGEGIY